MKTNSFESYQSLVHLNLTNCKIGEIEEGAFNGLAQLKTLELSNNELKEFNMQEIASSSPNLENIFLGNNAIESLADYNNSALSNLIDLDISNNKLTYLPTSILTKLSEINGFTVNMDGNSWDCENEKWAEYVTANNLTDIICPFVEESSTPVEEESAGTTTIEELGGDTTTISVLFDISERSASVNNNITTEENDTSQTTMKSKDLLAIWIMLAIMGGVIIGNSDRIWKWIRSKFTRNSNRSRSKCIRLYRIRRKRVPLITEYIIYRKKMF